MSKDREPCTEPDCGRIRHGRGLCKPHYQQQYRAGTLPPDLRARTIEQALAMRTEWQGGCLVWTGAKLRGDYGNMHVQGRNLQAHRAAYESVHGPIPAGMRVDHRCFNHSCVFIEHLRLATPKQNNENVQGLPSSNTSGFLGVTFDKKAGKFRAQLGHNGVKYHLGAYATAEEAGAAAKAKRLELFTHNDLDRAAA